MENVCCSFVSYPGHVLLIWKLLRAFAIIPFIFRDFLNCLRSFCTHNIIVISLLSFVIAMTASELSSYQKISICPYQFEEDWCRVVQAIPEIPSSCSKSCHCFPCFLISVFLSFHILWLWLKHELKTRGFILQGIWRRPVIILVTWIHVFTLDFAWNCFDGYWEIGNPSQFVCITSPSRNS